MKIVDFLKNVDSNKLSLDEQINYLREKKDYDANELIEAIKYLKKINGIEECVTRDAIDVCGTGGNKDERINTSTLIAFILAAGGVRVVKHGNKAQSGRYGSFDLLADLDVNFGARDEAHDQKIFKDSNLLFLFAPHFYSSLKSLAPARKDLKCFTFMNVLGPLLNPMNPAFQIIGCTDESKLEVIIETCKLLGKEKVIAYSCNGTDDFRIDQKTKIHKLSKGEIIKYEFDPKQLNFGLTEYEQIPKDKIQLYLQILGGNSNGCFAQHVILNATIAYSLISSNGIEQNFQYISHLLRSGLPLQKYYDYLRYNKLKNILYELSYKSSPSLKKLSLASNVAKSQKGIIAEIKYKSPSSTEGFLNSDLLPDELVKMYSANSKVVGISHVVEEKHFGGSFENLKKIKSIAPDLPLLAKGFFTTKEEVLKAKEFGADAILLIQNILCKYELRDLTQFAHNCGLEVLIEIDCPDQLSTVENYNPDIIGFNSRNLEEYKVKTKKVQLRSNIPLVYESGIMNFSDVMSVPDNFQALLIGTSIMNAPSVPLKLKELAGDKILKICGVRSAEIALKLDYLEVDLIGLNFIDYSKRRIDIDEAVKIREVVSSGKLAGLFDKKSFDFFEKINQVCKFDFVQLIGDESCFDISQINTPVISTFNIESEKDVEAANNSKAEFIILDGPVSGSGKEMDFDLLGQIKRPFIMAGGINIANIASLKTVHPYLIGFDIATGAETGSNTDPDLVRKIVNQMQNV